MSNVKADNPLKVLRNQAGFSLSSLAQRAGVSQALIVRAEQGVYENPPPALVDYLVDFTEEDHDELLAKYRVWQSIQRRSNYGTLLETLPSGGVYDQHPFINWRLASGIEAQIGVCKLYCVHPAVISKFELKPHLAQSLPAQLVSALLESGYRPSVLEELGDRYRAYRATLRTQVSYGVNQQATGPA